jgi:hypothetical protein
MKLLTCSLVIALAASVALAGTETCGWEGSGTVLALYGTGTPAMIVSLVSSPVHGGAQSLELEDNSPTGTPEAYIAWIVGLIDGDEVTASFWRYDTTPGASPSCRIWAHWNDDPTDVTVRNGSAGGNTDYGPGTGWDMTEYTWTVVDGHTGLVIVARTYSEAGDIVWIDDLTVTAPTGTTIFTPDNYTALEQGTWADIKSYDW